MRVAVLLLVTLVACAGGQGDDAAAPAPASPTPQATSEGDMITGSLGGDAQLEGGCAWVDDGRTRWQVEYPEGYELTLEPLRLVGPDGQTAEQGDTLTVTGEEATDVMTTCQVGPVWRATAVTFGGG